jgi:hypothetical protein
LRQSKCERAFANKQSESALSPYATSWRLISRFCTRRIGSLTLRRQRRAGYRQLSKWHRRPTTEGHSPSSWTQLPNGPSCRLAVRALVERLEIEGMQEPSPLMLTTPCHRKIPNHTPRPAIAVAKWEFPRHRLNTERPAVSSHSALTLTSTAHEEFSESPRRPGAPNSRLARAVKSPHVPPH